MDSLIPTNHNAFIPNQAIKDNIVIAHEAFHYLKMSQSRQHSIALKIDMYKVYNKVDWDFLWLVLIKIIFALQQVQLTMQCTLTICFSISINGVPPTPFFFLLMDCNKEIHHLLTYSYLFLRLFPFCCVRHRL